MPYDINLRLKEIRKSFNLSQADFANKIGVTRGVINNIEKNLTQAKPYVISLVCSVYGVNQNWLETGEGEMLSANQSTSTIFDRIRFVRKSLNMSQQEFGDSLGVNRSIIKNYELGIVSPTNIFINHLCMKHSVSKEWLLSGIGDIMSSNHSDSPECISQRIRELRKHLDMTQTEFGDSLGVSREVINTYENGRVTPPQTIIELLRLKHNVSPEWLNSGSSEMFCPKDDGLSTNDSDLPFSNASLKRLIESPDLIDRSIAFLQSLRLISVMDRNDLNLILSILNSKDDR